MKHYKFEISYVNTEKTLNKLIGEFNIYDFKKEDGKCSFCCENKDKQKIKKILINNGIKIKNQSFLGLFNNFISLKNWGILVGIIISSIMWIISTFFITDVLIIGNLGITQNEVFEILKEQNINEWSLKSSINIDELEQKIQDVKYISYVSAIIKGNALVINIKEELTNDEVVSVGKYEPLIAAYDGKITSINLIQGTAKVKVGDIVKLGDVLVEPYIEHNGEKLSVQPLADIVCDVWITTRFDVFDREIKKVKTGNCTSNYSLTVFGKEIYKTNNEFNYEIYEIEEKEEYLTTTLFPIKIKYTNVYECNYVEVENNFEENKQQFIEQTRQMSLLNVKEYDIIKNESYVVTKNNNINTIVYTITLSKKIC